MCALFRVCEVFCTGILTNWHILCPKQQEKDDESSSDEETNEVGRTLFVKNINFDSTEASMKEVIEMVLLVCRNLLFLVNKSACSSLFPFYV